MSWRPAPPFCVCGSTVIGPMPAIAERSSITLLPDDPAVALGDHGIEARVVEGHRQQPDRDLDARKVGGNPCSVLILVNAA